MTAQPSELELRWRPPTPDWLPIFLGGALMVVVGQRVRVAPPSADGVSRRALVLALDGESDVEIEYEGGEEAVVPVASCTAVLAFEEASFVAPASGRSAARIAKLSASFTSLSSLCTIH